MRSLILLCSAVAVAVPLGAPAQVVAPAVPSPSQTAQGDVSVTIYNNNRALVEDRRLLDLPAGRSRQRADGLNKSSPAAGPLDRGSRGPEDCSWAKRACNPALTVFRSRDQKVFPATPTGPR